MNIKPISSNHKQAFNKLASHPLQSWEWGQFRQETGVKVVRLGRYQNDKLVETAQITIHPLPASTYTVAYFPKGGIPSKAMVEKLIEVGKKHNCIFIKLEPNVEVTNSYFELLTLNFELVRSPHPLFPKYTFKLDLRQSEQDILKNMHQKTRYNIKLAIKKGVTVSEDNSQQSFNCYLNLLFRTTKRQKFYAHNKKYHTQMWKILFPAKIAHILKASYKRNGQVYTLASWVVFLFHKTIYYPYGGSSEKFTNVMASNLLMWEVIKFGKKHGAEELDMWGAAGPNISYDDPWYGFHRFKKGYGARLIQFVGSFDLILKPNLYRLYSYAYGLRQVWLKG